MRINPTRPASSGNGRACERVSAFRAATLDLLNSRWNSATTHSSSAAPPAPIRYLGMYARLRVASEEIKAANETANRLLLRVIQMRCEFDEMIANLKAVEHKQRQRSSELVAIRRRLELIDSRMEQGR